MSQFLEQLKADAVVRFWYEIEQDGVITFTSGTTDSAPVDYGEDPWSFGGLPITANSNGGFVTPNITKTILHFENVGHLMPMEWTIERKEYDNATGTLQNTDTHVLTLITTASFTCETSLADGMASFTSTIKSPV